MQTEYNFLKGKLISVMDSVSVRTGEKKNNA